MKRVWWMLLSFMLMIGLMPAACAEEETLPCPVVWEQGTIFAASGLERDYPIVIRTAEYLRISDYVGLTLNAGHYITYFVYDSEYNYLGNGSPDLTANFLLSGQGISTHEMRIRYPEGVYFRIALWRGKNGEMTPDMLDGAGVKFHDAASDPVFWEMGSIYAKNGETFVREQVIRTVGYLPVSDYAGAGIAEDYSLSFLAYDKDLNYLGNGNPAKTGYFHGSGVPVLMEEIREQYPETEYVKFLFRAEPMVDIPITAIEDSKVRVYPAGETVPAKTWPYQGMNVHFDAEYALGVLNPDSGIAMNGANSFYTEVFLPLDQISRITWNQNYGLLWCAYDEEQQFLGSGDGDLTCGELSKTEILNEYSDASLLGLCIRSDGTSGLEEMIRSSAIAIHSDLRAENRMTFKSAMTAQKSQDGAIYNGILFLMNAAGSCTVYDLNQWQKTGTFKLDNIEVLNPHANSVCFSDVFYDEEDPFPLLYVNIYNNYWKQTDRKEGICCVYRLFEKDGAYSSDLVQVLQIGFVEDLDLWKSMAGTGDYLPYGNFVVDTDEDMLYAFVLRDGTKQTRFFRFALPDINAGEYCEAYGCNLVTLNSTDILDRFDTEHFSIIQGCTYSDGKIYSVNGFGGGRNSLAEMKVIDLKTKSVRSVLDFNALGITQEPEMISFDAGGSGELYYLCIDGVLRKLQFMDFASIDIPYEDRCYAHFYENGVCTLCGEADPALQDTYPEILHGHLQSLPDDIHAGTNLWQLLEPENEYFYAGTHWGTLDEVVSVTIPISQGDQIYASSFSRGIRVSFFGRDGVLVSLSNTEVKAEFEANGYITAPDGAIAVNIPMWENSGENVLRILTLESVECQKHVFTQLETVAQAGLVSKGTAIQYCENCGHAEMVELPELMLAGEYAYKDEETALALPYRIYYPSSYENGGKTYPVVIFYHGAGSRGTDNQSQVLGKSIINRLVKLDNCIILAPQCNTDCQWVNTPWSKGSYASASIQRSVYLDASIALLDEIVLAKNVDKESVYAIGLSMGGYAAWNVVMEYPEKFAAVVPICGAADPGRAKDALGVAVWAFHGDQDPTVPVSGSREMIEAIRACGGIDVRYTEYAGVGHDSWSNAAAEPELTEWLFSQKKHIHRYNAVVTIPSCAEQGYTTYTCVCGDSYVENYVPAAGHVYDDDRDADCNTCGEVREVAGATVRGTVKGSRGAKVTLRGAESCETTDSYEFTGVAQGIYDLVVKEGGCLTYTVKNILVEESDIVLAEIELVRGDMNGDDMINARDIGVFRRDFGKTIENCANPYTDLNGDGNVNARDINLLRRSFGKSTLKDCTVEYTA